jgi:hypothetical protein
MAKQYTKIAIADIGTQMFWFNKNIVDEVEASAGLTVTIDDKTFLQKVDYATETVFTYASSGTTWKLGTEAVTLSEYGITVTGSPANEDAITLSYSGGKFEYATPITAGAEFGGDTESFEASETDLDYVPKIGGRSTLNDIAYTLNYTSEKYQRVLDISDNTEENIYMEVMSDGSAFVFAGTSGMPTVTAGDVRQITWTIVPSVVVFVDAIDNMSAKCKTRVQSINTALVDGDAINIDASTIPTIRQDYYTTKKMG